MGTFRYGSSIAALAVDDRSLLHLQIVIVTKLRRHERFVFRASSEQNAACGETFWMSPDIPLLFEYEEPEPAPLSRAWLGLLKVEASKPSGLWIAPEPGVPVRRKRALVGASR